MEKKIYYNFCIFSVSCFICTFSLHKKNCCYLISVDCPLLSGAVAHMSLGLQDESVSFFIYFLPLSASCNHLYVLVHVSLNSSSFWSPLCLPSRAVTSLFWSFDCPYNFLACCYLKLWILLLFSICLLSRVSPCICILTDVATGTCSANYYLQSKRRLVSQIF